MRLSIVHDTHYRYSSPVVLSQQLLHLTPRALPWQTCDAHRISVEPTAGEIAEREDYYGNRTLHLLLAVPHDALVVRAESEVSVKPRAQIALGAPKASWEAVRARLRALDAPPLIEPAEFLYESRMIPDLQYMFKHALNGFRALLADEALNLPDNVAFSRFLANRMTAFSL